MSFLTCKSNLAIVGLRLDANPDILGLIPTRSYLE